MSVLTQKDLTAILEALDQGYELVGGTRMDPQARAIVMEGLKALSRARAMLTDAIFRMGESRSLTLSDVALTDEVILHIAHQYDMKYADIADLPLSAVDRHHAACAAVRKTVRHYLHTNKFRHYKDIELFERTLGVSPLHKED